MPYGYLQQQQQQRIKNIWLRYIIYINEGFAYTNIYWKKNKQENFLFDTRREHHYYSRTLEIAPLQLSQMKTNKRLHSVIIDCF